MGGGARPPARELGVGALLASAGLIASFAALGLNSIAVSRIEGPDGAGLVALSTQVVVIATFVAGIGLRTSVAYRVSAGLWSPRSAARRSPRGTSTSVICPTRRSTWSMRPARGCGSSR